MIEPACLSDDLSRRGVGRALHIAGIDRAGGLEAQNRRFLIGASAMLNPARHDDAFAGLERDHAVETRREAGRARP